MNNGPGSNNKISRISEALEESCKVIRSSLDFLVQQHKVKRLIEGADEIPRSVNHLQEKLEYLEEVQYLNPAEKANIKDFFNRYEAIGIKLKQEELQDTLNEAFVDEADSRIKNLDQAITLYFRDYTQLALMLVQRKVNAF